MEARLDATRRMLRDSGGGSQRKLHFEMLVLDRKIGKAATAVERAERGLADAESGVLEAIEKRDKAAAALEAERVRLQNARAHLAHFTLQAAAESNAHSEKYSAMHREMQRLHDMLCMQPGMEAAAQGLRHVVDFLSAFVPSAYIADQDPMLQDACSDEGDSPTDVEQADHLVDADTFIAVDPVVQAERDLDDLKKCAEEAAAGAVKAAAARAVAAVQGQELGDATPSPAAIVQQYQQRVQAAETRLQEARAQAAAEVAAFPEPGIERNREAAMAAAAAATAAAAGHSSDAGDGDRKQDVARDGPEDLADSSPSNLPAAFATAARAASLPMPPETSALPVAFATAGARWPRLERRFPPAEGGPRGRARSTGARFERGRSRSAGGARAAEHLDEQGDQVI